MSGPEHYRKAEALMRRAEGRNYDDLSRDKIAAAQVHATLALAAATALGPVIPGSAAQEDWVRAVHGL